MKKLLALILCVMLFVSIVPTAAFAVDIPTSWVPTTSGKYVPAWASKNAAQDAVDAATDTITALYQTLAADQGVFAVVSAIDGVVKGISDDLWKDVDTFGVLTGDAANDLTKLYLRTVIGDEIMNYMNSHYASFATHTTRVEADGTVSVVTRVDPEKYMNTFATAASKAIGSEKAIKNIQALVLGLAAMKQYDDFLDDLDDLRDDITLWNDGKGASVWATYFDDNGSLTGQWVLPVIDGGDAYMDPFALIEPHRVDNNGNNVTSATVFEDVWSPVIVAAREIAS